MGSPARYSASVLTWVRFAAGARILAPEMEALVTYDDRLANAATDAGLATVSPGMETA